MHSGAMVTGYRAMARQTGRLADWDDARGFGFIETDEGTRLFVHISSFGPSTIRPRIGDRVRFAAGTGRDGRPAAVAVAILGANPVDAVSRRRGAPARPAELRDYVRVGGAGLIGLLCLAVAAFGRGPLWLPGVYLGVGLLSALSYGVDKQAAEAGRWRVSETWLLGVDFAGGIAGGLLAQRLLRHKTAKASFVAASVVIAVLHLGLLSALLAGLVKWP